MGYESRVQYGGCKSRLWTYERLTEAFETEQFGYFDIKKHPEKLRFKFLIANELVKFIDEI